jgi:hypothetical protein
LIESSGLPMPRRFLWKFERKFGGARDLHARCVKILRMEFVAADVSRLNSFAEELEFERIYVRCHAIYFTANGR